MAREDYQKALKKGERSYARYLSEGKYPYLQVLEELLSHTDVVAEEDLYCICTELYAAAR